MRHRFLVVIGALVAVVAACLTPVLFANQTAPTASATVFRTSWGDPDLQGVWLGTTPTPLERPLDGGTVVFTEARESVVDNPSTLAIMTPGRSENGGGVPRIGRSSPHPVQQRMSGRPSGR